MQTTQDIQAIDTPIHTPTEAATMVLKLGYRGADFSGFAAQPGGVRTVAGELYHALSVFLHRPVEITCAGRTDAGVHALAQHVSLPVYKNELGLSGSTVKRALNALVGDDISVSEVYRAPAGFSARFDAEARSYRYRIVEGWTRPIMAWNHAWWLRAQLDVEAMDRAAQALVGEHDFKSFCKAASAIDKPTHRNVMSVQVARIEEAGEQLIAVDITGNAFLHSMVRTIVGSLVEVGTGRREEQWISQVLAACNRRAAGQCAPAKGLVFAAVQYPEGSFEPWL
ncbi:MAG: tRNA pseudouridine(38-40) synthase TruA [Atopobium sp.]|uniref:tRNA pseudouridine(38-40) synthase TruA n=1 Tax=Atopobium sp. TaxID=1872650 RepID=UPI002A7ED670|nr:tRNA pseudouridine(38-40) synthase TruA [Atopobium sp.]MDY4523034.1 tRNA pseudouridine(38-40) synthase TruA [Atopobium sp.]